MGPFRGLTVIEFGRFIAAPYCGQLMADGGADVIKVEPLHGDDARRNGTRLSPTEARQFLNKNRGKRSIAVKLSDADVRRALHRLLDRTDVVIANFRPGQAEDLGLDYDTLAATNPRLIYAENTGFGKRGPLSHKAGMDMVLQAYTGLAPLAATGPMPLNDPVIDYTAALLMAWGIATALYDRERRGRGQRLDVSLLQAALVLQNNSINHIDAVDGWRNGFVDYLKGAFQEGRSFADVLAQRDAVKPTIEPPYYGVFQAQDGLLALAAGGRALQRRAVAVLGVTDPTLAQEGLVPEDIAAHTRAMRGQVAAAIRGRPVAHWLAEFERASVPAGPVLLKDQVLTDEQVLANDYVVRLDHEQVGGMTVVAPPVKFSATPLASVAPSPVLGQHTREVLAQAGVDAEDIEAMITRGAVVAVPASAQ